MRFGQLKLLISCLLGLIKFATSEEPTIIDVGGPPNNLIGYNGVPPQQVPIGPEYGYQNPVDDTMYYYNNMNPIYSGSDGFAPPVQPYQGVPPAWDGNPASEWYLVDKNYQPGGQYNYPGPGQGPWQGAAPVSGVFPGAFPSETYYSGLPQIPVSGDINGFAPQSVPNGPWSVYGPQPMNQDDPCAVQWEMEYDCPPELPEQPEQPPDLVPVCELSVCIASCQQYMGSTYEGACFNSECFCRNTYFPPEPEPEKPVDKPKDWSYENQDEWPEKYPECGKSPQSPIDVKPEHLRDLTRKIRFENYDAPISFTVENNGHGVRMYVQGNVTPAVEITGLTYGEEAKDWSGNYTLAFLDLHWATSEHSVNALKVNMEAQLHHYNSWFDTYDEAVENQGQTLALAVLFTESVTDNDLDEEIFASMTDIVKPDNVGKNTKTKDYLRGLPSTLGNTFGVYRGSQTHPPCHRGVRWLIAQQMFKIGSDKMAKLQALEDINGKPILQNVRNLKQN